MKLGSPAVSLLLTSSLLASPAVSLPLPPQQADDLVDAPAPGPGPAPDCALTGRIDPDGRLRRREVAAVTSFFVASHTASVGEELDSDGTSAPAGGIPGVKPRTAGIKRVNYVDDEIFGAMDRAGVKSAPVATDEEFLRRVTLDLTGRIPDAATVQSFVADQTADKRDRMIDTLLASDAFVDRWAFFLDELVRNTGFADSGRLFSLGRNAYHAYFVDALRSKKPYDQLVRELITGLGDSTTRPSANYAIRNLQTNGPAQDTFDNLAADASKIFLGTNVFCTSCHNGSGHTDTINIYLSTVRREDFWHQAAFFARTQIRRQGDNPGNYYYTVTDAAQGDYRLNTTTGNKTTRDATWTSDGKTTTITPRYLATGGLPQNGESYRAAYARMLTADPQFARATANYLWKELFVLGIVEPANDWDLLRQDPANPPPDPWTIQATHPDLVKKLGQDFAAGFDLRAILRTMVRSSAYQLSAFYPGEWSETYAPYFARHFVRRLRGEEIYDAITKATNVSYQLPVQGYASPVLWAGQLPDPVEPQATRGAVAPTAVKGFLDSFLRGDRDADARSSQFSISQSLLLLNDKTVVTDRVKAATTGSLVNQLAAKKATATERVTSLYLSTLSRYPTASELATGVTMLTSLKTGQTIDSATEDLAYSLINKIDFFLNY